MSRRRSELGDNPTNKPSIGIDDRDNGKRSDEDGTIARGRHNDPRQKRFLVVLIPIVAVVAGLWRKTVELSHDQFFDIDGIVASQIREYAQKDTNVSESGLSTLENAAVVASHLQPTFSPELSHDEGIGGSNALEMHYLSVYRSQILLRESPPQFVVFRMATHGIGNKIRSMLGGFFLAAIMDRVFLLDSHVISSLFDPPRIGGVQLDWNMTLAKGACDRNSTLVNINATRTVYNPYLVDFYRHYGNSKCIIVSASHGHDRQVASLNENTYKSKVMKLFGNSLSRFNWSRDVLGLALQQPSEALLLAGRHAMRRLQLDSVPPSHRIAVQLRTFYDQSQRWQNEILARAPEIWKCVERLVRQRILEVKRREDSQSFVVLIVSDSPVFKAEASNRLETIDGVRVVQSGLHITHTEDVFKDMDPFTEWFLMGECSGVIASGYSSFGLTAFFRPSQFPPSSTSAKQLFTMDRLGMYKYMNMQNNKCGKVQSTGYGDINFGIMDPPYSVHAVEAALSKYAPIKETMDNPAGESTDISSQKNDADATAVGELAPAFISVDPSGLSRPVLGGRRNLSVVSFSLFGNDTKYIIPSIFNAQQFIPKFYPGWQMRVYHDLTVPTEALEELQRHSHVRLIYIKNESDPLLDPAWFEWLPSVEPTVWRFLVAADPAVDVFIIRDSDSIPTAREQAAVEEWFQSGAAFHILHDFPIHYYNNGKVVEILAGMWGGRGGRAVPNMPDLLREHYLTGGHHEANSYNFTYGGDQAFLSEVVWPIVEAAGPGGSARHNSFHCKNNSGVAFPTALEGDVKGYDFVGEQVKVEKELKGKRKNKRELGTNSIIGWKMDESRSGARWVRKFFIRPKWRKLYLGCIKRRMEMELK